MRSALFALCLTPAFAPGIGFAAGGGDSTPPTTTNTTTVCASGLVWDTKSGACVAPQESSLSDDQRYEAVRELAYAGKIAAAQKILASMSDQSEPRVQTYWGFTHGRLGDLDRALGHYDRALATDPDNELARSYRGQALVAAGRVREARIELARIAGAGKGETWAAVSLRDAIASGEGYSY